MESTFTPLALAVVLLGGATVLFGPRKHVVAVILFVGVFLSLRNKISIFGLDFMVHRILVVLGWTRLLLSREYRGLEILPIDKVAIAFAVWSVIAYTTLWGTFGALVYRLGVAFDIIGLYFLFRILIRTWDDLEKTVCILGVVCVVLAACMTVEAVTRKNPLALLGGLNEEVWSRKGRLRCRGAFGHAITAGLFGASLLPLWIVAWVQKPPLRKWAVIGSAASLVITGTSGSSSPVMAVLAGLFGLALWRFKDQLRLIRWGVVFLLVGLHMVMKAPVWALLSRVNIVGGSTGYHRFRLFDQFVNRVGEWWLLGVKSTEDWGTGLWDVTNQFVLEGVRGGIVGLALFVTILVLCFRQVGRTLASIRQDRRRSLVVWAFGVMLFVHCVSFWGNNYWDQIVIQWYLLLAITAGLPQILQTTKEALKPLPTAPWGSCPVPQES